MRDAIVTGSSKAPELEALTIPEPREAVPSQATVASRTILGTTRGLMWVGGAYGEGMRQAAWSEQSVPRLVALVPSDQGAMRRAQTPSRTCP